MATIFFSYSHADEALRDQLEKHLTMLKRAKVIDTFYDRRISAGSHVDQSISSELERADIILLLVSVDFLASSYCYDIEMQRALERHKSGEAKVIPVILRRCDWKGAPFGNLLATPLDGKPVTTFPDLDEGFLQVVTAVRQAINMDTGSVGRVFAAPRVPSPEALRRAAGPRSSNLRLPQSFTDADVDRFGDDAFEYIAKFFENSLDELSRRNPGIEGTFKRIDANQFTAVIYKNGRKAAWCSVFRQDGMMGNGIALSLTETLGHGGFNENLNLRADSESMYLHALGMSREVKDRLTFEGAAEYYWGTFVDRLRH